MNYEELIESRDAEKLGKTELPIGVFYKKQVDGKYQNVVDIRQDLNESILFCEGLKTEAEKNTHLINNHQLHFSPITENDDIVRLQIEQGSFVSFSQLLFEHPAIVAGKNFIDNVVKDLLKTTSYLHEQGIYHVCYSPQSIFARHGDNAPMLLSHGSFYFSISDPHALYGTDAKYVAPEVLNKGAVDGRCDIYSIGKFMETLFDTSEIPFEYKRVIKKATSEKPEDRYDTPEDMLRAINVKRNARHTLLTTIGAIVIALLCVGLYFELFPETDPIEYVKPVPKQATDDLLDDGFKPEELGVVTHDSLINQMSDDEIERQKEYEAKAEQIFRKQYEAKAEEIISKVYNKNYLSATEKQFMLQSQSMTEELTKAQLDIAEASSLNQATSQRIASEIIERLTEKKKAELSALKKGIQK